MIQGLILAAGKGCRLGTLLNGKPKGLLSIGGLTLIEHQIGALRACGISRIGVVVGHGSQYVRRTLDAGIEFIENERYASTNSLYSLWCARRWIESGFVMANSDLFADIAIYQRVVASPSSALAYDSSSGTDSEQMKVALRRGRVVELNKSMTASEAAGESIGLIKFDAGVAARVLDAADRIVRGGSLNDWSPAAVSAVAPHAQIAAIDIAGMPWTEIDFPEDYEYAAGDVWKRMQSRAAAAVEIGSVAVPLDEEFRSVLTQVGDAPGRAI